LLTIRRSPKFDCFRTTLFYFARFEDEEQLFYAAHFIESQ
jgi:hypothetical protein